MAAGNRRLLPFRIAQTVRRLATPVRDARLRAFHDSGGVDVVKPPSDGYVQQGAPAFSILAKLRSGAFGVGLFVVALIGVSDVLTGQQATMSQFYVLSVVFVTWFSSRRAGMALAWVCAAAGVMADHLVSEPYLHFGHSFESEAVPLWNGASRLLVYAIAAYLVSSLQATLHERTRLIGELQQAVASIRTLEGLLPMCAWCRTIRDEQRAGEWVSIEAYIRSHTDAQVSHGICPTCAQKHFGRLDAPPSDAVGGERSSRHR